MAAQAANDFLFQFHGLLLDDAMPGYRMHYPRERAWQNVEVNADPDRLLCGVSGKSAYARGDRGVLPCRTKKK